MDTATRILHSDHEALRKMLEFTKNAADRMRRGESVQPEVLARIVEFFRVFVEGCLITKEEDFLVPALERRGLSRHGGPIASMLIDHASGRRLMKEMAKASAAYEDGSREAGMKWTGVASDFADLMCAISTRRKRSFSCWQRASCSQRNKQSSPQNSKDSKLQRRLRTGIGRPTPCRRSCSERRASTTCLDDTMRCERAPLIAARCSGRLMPRTTRCKNVLCALSSLNVLR